MHWKPRKEGKPRCWSIFQLFGVYCRGLGVFIARGRGVLSVAMSAVQAWMEGAKQVPLEKLWGPSWLSLRALWTPQY